MCRHIGYVGAAVAVSEPVTAGAHSLRVQSWAPREMRGFGTINADGFGVGWWRADGTAARYRSSMPIWTDPAVDEVLTQITSSSVIAAVRAATIGMPVERTACAPFTAGRWAFSLNGFVPQWREVFRELGVDGLDAESAMDSAVLWTYLQRLLAHSPPGEALSAAILTVARPSARLNLLLGDGERLWATTYGHSLYVLEGEGMAYVASEPFDDDPRWRPVPDRMLVSVSSSGVQVQAL